MAKNNERFAVIGMGRFGIRLASTLAAAGQEVIGIDSDPAVVDEMRDRVTLSIAMDATEERALREQGVDQVDAAVVSIGGNLEPIVLTTMLLKQMGVPKVIARAISPTSAKVLERVGADEVVSPEDESADRWADRLLSPHFLNHFELDVGFGIVEVATPEKWAGHTLAELDLRAKHGLHVIAIKRQTSSSKPDRGRRVVMPSPADPLLEEDVIVFMGQDRDLARIPRR